MMMGTKVFVVRDYTVVLSVRLGGKEERRQFEDAPSLV
jgi:hypothetical protein